MGSVDLLDLAQARREVADARTHASEPRSTVVADPEQVRRDAEARAAREARAAAPERVSGGPTVEPTTNADVDRQLAERGKV